MTANGGAARRLAGEFTREMLGICDRFKREIDYNPVRFRQMVVEHGGPETARRLLAGAHAQLGLETLRWHRRLGESVEAYVSFLATGQSSLMRNAKPSAASWNNTASTWTPSWPAAIEGCSSTSGHLSPFRGPVHRTAGSL